jgi:hypothetical protein
MEIGNGWIDLCGMNFIKLKFGARVCVCVDLVRGGSDDEYRLDGHLNTLLYTYS